MMAHRPLVCVCVPVWEGAAFVAETLKSILDQREVDFIVRISVDGADEESADACSAFLTDDRVELTVQPTRLGWVKNTNWLLERAQGNYVCVQPHDDLLAENYLRTLLDVAGTTPEAAVVYSDIQLFGDHTGTIAQPPVVGSPLARQLALLFDHFSAVAFRGLARTDAIRAVGVPAGGSFKDFAADTIWVAQLARAGELHRVPAALYRKRYHSCNTHAAWQQWSLNEKVQAWGHHCADMLEQALAIDGLQGTERAILARAATLRASKGFGFAGGMDFRDEDRRQMMVAFCEAAKAKIGEGWEPIFLGSEALVIDDIVEARAYPSTERELQQTELELERMTTRLSAIEHSTAWRLSQACTRAALRVPFARSLTRKFLQRSRGG